jgi:hypothetical protein
MSILGSASIEQEYSIVPELCLIRLPEGMTVEDGIKALGDSNDVLYVEPNYEVLIPIWQRICGLIKQNLLEHPE